MNHMKPPPRGFCTLLILAVACRLAVGQEVQSARSAEVLTNSVGMQLVHIPAGEFWMGAPESADELCKAFASYERQPEEFSDEYPRHKVKITKPFLLGRHEVTVGQYRQFTTDTGYQTQAETDGKGGWGYDPATGICSGRHVKFNWREPGFPQTDNHPVLNVTWDDAVAFCDWLSRKEGKRYRLPSEAEWEYAYRGGTTTPDYASGDIGWHSRNSGSKTHPVGEKPANPFGLYDMSGHVKEWCIDAGAEPLYRVLRGSSFYGMATSGATARSTGRIDEVSRNNGFRVVAEKRT
jgi:formylglycine-generating enzyme required for sulfatase activity